ncbi:hypothetical protein R75465_07597 [Paraburkholderia aspalathi]|nr:hypothetical protein R75465_07597 [Paraburkholderia aspalathi]
MCRVDKICQRRNVKDWQAYSCLNAGGERCKVGTFKNDARHSWTSRNQLSRCFDRLLFKPDHIEVCTLLAQHDFSKLGFFGHSPDADGQFISAAGNQVAPVKGMLISN